EHGFYGFHCVCCELVRMSSHLKDRRCARDLDRAATRSAIMTSLSSFCPSQTALVLVKIERWFPAGIANRRRTATSLATKSRSNQSSPAFFGVFARKPANREKVFPLLRAG